MRKLVVGLCATILFAVLLAGGVVLAHSSEPEIEESVGMSGFTFAAGGCDTRQACVFSGFVSTVELNDQTKVLRHVTLILS